MLDADPALKAAWEGFTAQLARSSAAVTASGPWDEVQVDEAVAEIMAARDAVRDVYVAAGLDPDKAHDAPDDPE